MKSKNTIEVLKVEPNEHKKSETVPIRVSKEIYELLREKAFYERTTIREIADEIIYEYLNSSR